MLELAVTVLTVAMSGVVAAVVTYRLNANRDRLFAMRSKVEQLYLQAETYTKGLACVSIAHRPYLEGKATFDQLRQMVSEGTPENMGDAYTSMTMLIRIYFPRLEPALDRLIEARSSVNKFYGPQAQITKQSLEQFDVRLKELDSAIAAILERIICEGRRLAQASEHLAK